MLSITWPWPMRMPARAFGNRYGAWLMFSIPPAIMMVLVPALIWSWAMMTACMPEPHILLMVVQPLLSGIPAARDACRAGAWPRPAGSTQPMMISCISAGCSPARSMAALMETAPSSGERTELKEPIMPPIGVLAEPAITISLFMFYVLLQRNLIGVLVLLIGLVWAPSLSGVRAGTRGMGYFSSGKNNSLRSDIFFPARKIPHPPLPTCSTGIPRAKRI